MIVNCCAIEKTIQRPCFSPLAGQPKQLAISHDSRCPSRIVPIYVGRDAHIPPHPTSHVVFCRRDAHIPPNVYESHGQKNSWSAAEAIFYFSGTGNSQLAAKLLAGITGGQLISINQYMKEGKRAEFRSERPLVFVTPTYAWRMPRVVERWIRQAEFSGCRDAYFILTCAGGCGNAAAYAKALCKRKGLRFRGLAPVAMPENYVAMFATPSAEKCRDLVERAKPQIAALAAQIQQGAPLSQPPGSVKNKLLSGPVNALYYPLIVHDKKFTVSEDCVSCGKCARRCPLNNIRLESGRPVWNGNCTHCMACIAGCPARAIEYGEKSKGRHRHDIMEE